MNKLSKHLTKCWENREINSLNRNIKKEHASFYCCEQKEDGLHLVNIKFVKDTLTFKDRIINYSVENGLDAKFGCSLIAAGIMDLKNDEPMEERWGYVENYKLIDGHSNIPIITRKKEK